MSALNLYDISIPQLIHTLQALSKILSKAEAEAESKGLTLDDLVAGRIAPDMHPLPFQIQTACNSAKFVAVRVANGVANVEMKDEEKTFPEFHSRIIRTIEFLQDVKREQFDGVEDKEVTLLGIHFTAVSYIVKFAMPNFYFHVTTAYDILRMKGIDVGKLDFLGVEAPSKK